ncbi:integrase catalytic domain-containing protein [Trichonephila inaurata madagascariensis]|uniref:Integrase catalytic domain-containing protein n=1 Tax=Trichonephila inaurata madagascariensis TaxID=2747483 RepID=A0A8X6X190_9ARAC|nr:integrase catalytic domain-containing protein [Trichonephila inaurata madagascariensis]
MDSNVLSDAILLHMLNSKIDRELQRLFQLNLKTTEVPSLQDFFSFLETRCIQLESIRKTDFDTKSIPENVNLGDSRSIASKRLDQLWKRLNCDPKLNNLYTKFIEEYLSLDHMEEITNIDDITSVEGFFLPHHGVLRAGNRSRPLRVVFNGSQKTDLDISLNDVLCKGGVIPDLFSIMLHGRKHAYFFSCDISHMFRQIEIHPHQTFSKNSLEKSYLKVLECPCTNGVFHSTNDFSDLHFDQSSEESITKPLGVLWNSSSDTFCFKVSPSTNHIFTKRDVHSQIARIFDPLGLLGPVISKAKFFMQQLWLLKLEWHEKLPVPVAAEWASFVQSLPVLEKLKIPRFVLSENLESIILYGFSDALEKGFGAVTYVSVIRNNGDRHSQLLCSKSRVAPLKTLTIPRLELSACLLLSKLVRKVINALKTNLSQVILFSDSTIALSWIKTPPHLLKTFVANRVAKIQELTELFMASYFF